MGDSKASLNFSYLNNFIQSSRSRFFARDVYIDPCDPEYVGYEPCYNLWYTPKPKPSYGPPSVLNTIPKDLHDEIKNITKGTLLKKYDHLPTKCEIKADLLKRTGGLCSTYTLDDNVTINKNGKYKIYTSYLYNNVRYNLDFTIEVLDDIAPFITVNEINASSHAEALNILKNSIKDNNYGLVYEVINEYEFLRSKNDSFVLFVNAIDIVGNEINKKIRVNLLYRQIEEIIISNDTHLSKDEILDLVADKLKILREELVLVDSLYFLYPLATKTFPAKVLTASGKELNFNITLANRPLITLNDNQQKESKNLSKKKLSELNILLYILLFIVPIIGFILFKL